MKRLLILLAACGDSGGTEQPDAPIAIDAAIDAPAPAFETCTGPCKTTALTAALAATRSLDKAYYGINASGTLHVEAYRNAPAGCPTASSPSPDYTLILGSVPVPTDTTPSTSPGNILDFKGDLLNGPLGAAATAVTITPVAAKAVTTPTGFVALDLSLTFAAGTVIGHLYATHCTSIDE